MFKWALLSKRYYLIDQSVVCHRHWWDRDCSITLCEVAWSSNWWVLPNYPDRQDCSRFFQLCQTKAIRRYLPTDATKSLVNTLVISKLDYCNQYMHDCRRHSCTIYSVFIVTFSVAHSTRITLLLLDHLHWLQTPETVKYKLVWSFLKRYLGLLRPVIQTEGLHPAIIVHINFDRCIDRWQASWTKTHIKTIYMGVSVCCSWTSCVKKFSGRDQTYRLFHNI